MRLSEPQSPDRLTLGFTYLGCPQHPPAAIVTWPGWGTRTALAQGASLPPLQEIPSILSQHELIPRSCGQPWGSLWLPGAIGSEHAPGQETPSSPLPSLWLCSPSVSSVPSPPQ